MAFFEGFGRYRDKLAFIAGSTRTFGKPFYFRWPQNIVFSLTEPVDVWLYRIIIADGYTLPVFFERVDRTVIVFKSPFGIARRVQQAFKPFFLNFVRVFHK